MIEFPPLTIEKYADEEGILEEEVTKKDIVQRLQKMHNIRVDETDVIFVSDALDANGGTAHYGPDEPPMELGLWRVKIKGLYEPIRYWVVPKPMVEMLEEEPQWIAPAGLTQEYAEKKNQEEKWKKENEKGFVPPDRLVQDKTSYIYVNGVWVRENEYIGDVYTPETNYGDLLGK